MSAWDDPAAHIRGLEAEVQQLRRAVMRAKALARQLDRDDGGLDVYYARRITEALDDD